MRKCFQYTQPHNYTTWLILHLTLNDVVLILKSFVKKTVIFLYLGTVHTALIFCISCTFSPLWNVSTSYILFFNTCLFLLVLTWQFWPDTWGAVIATKKQFPPGMNKRVPILILNLKHNYTWERWLCNRPTRCFSSGTHRFIAQCSWWCTPPGHELYFKKQTLHWHCHSY